MITFFRKIRNQLLLENKTAKYLKYAIGEIILVVIGILIALQINNWNEERKMKNIESAFLRNINEEFKSNRRQFNARMEQHRRIGEGMDSMIAIFPITNKNWDTIHRIYYTSQFANQPTFNPSESSIESLINSSTFDVIQNDNLRKYLLAWPDLVNDYKEEEDAANNVLNNYFNPVRINETKVVFDENRFLRRRSWTMSEKSFHKFENIVILRKGTYSSILRPGGDSESDKVSQAIDSIIKYTGSYTN